MILIGKKHIIFQAIYHENILVDTEHNKEKNDLYFIHFNSIEILYHIQKDFNNVQMVDVKHMD